MNNKYAKIIILLTSVVLLSACATMNRDECNNADWKIIGLEDGADGRLPSYIGEHRSACAEHGIAPNLAAYQAGHSIGVKQYCTATNGYYLGKSGDNYNGVCPPELEDAFLPAYIHGQEYHELQTHLYDINHEIDNNEYEIERMKKQLSIYEKQIISSQTKSQRRAELLDKIKKYHRDIGRLEEQIVELIRQRYIVEDRLNIHSQRNTY